MVLTPEKLAELITNDKLRFYCGGNAWEHYIQFLLQKSGVIDVFPFHSVDYGIDLILISSLLFQHNRQCINADQRIYIFNIIISVFQKIATFIFFRDADRKNKHKERFLCPITAGIFFDLPFQLCRSADKDDPDHRLPIPVRLYLDDFATNFTIPDFDNVISVIRSREICVSVILQSITQLDALYGPDRAKTILNNCDQLLYLGGQDLETARFISEKTNVPLHWILSMPLDQAWLFLRGQPPRTVRKAEAN